MVHYFINESATWQHCVRSLMQSHHRVFHVGTKFSFEIEGVEFIYESHRQTLYSRVQSEATWSTKRATIRIQSQLVRGAGCFLKKTGSLKKKKRKKKSSFRSCVVIHPWVMSFSTRTALHATCPSLYLSQTSARLQSTGSDDDLTDIKPRSHPSISFHAPRVSKESQPLRKLLERIQLVVARVSHASPLVDRTSQRVGSTVRSLASVWNEDPGSIDENGALTR